MTGQRTKPSGENVGPAVLLVGGFGLLNLLVVGIVSHVDEAILVAPFFGLVAGEFAVPVVWSVLAPQRIAARLAAALGMLAWLLGTFFLGCLMAGMPPPGPEQLAVALSMLPILLLAAQLPVWILRAAMGCRLAVGVEGLVEAPTDARQFRVRDLLVTTAVVATCLGLAQWGIRLAGVPSGQGAMILGVLAGYCGGIALWSALVLLPGIWAALIVRNKALGASVYFGAAGGAWLAILLIGTVASGEPPPPVAVFSIFLFMAAVTGSVLGSLHALRACGLVLVWPRRKGRSEALGEPTTPFAVVEAEGSPFAGGGSPTEASGEDDTDHPET